VRRIQDESKCRRCLVETSCLAAVSMFADGGFEDGNVVEEPGLYTSISQELRHMIILLATDEASPGLEPMPPR
jgi:hypothetical protein